MPWKNMKRAAAYKRQWYLKNKERWPRYFQRWYNKNKAKAQLAHRQWNAKNKEHVRDYGQNYSTANRRKIRASWLARRYGITHEQYDEMVKKQNGRCAICGQKPIGRPLYLDHDHKSSKIRELLCRTCNARLGQLENGDWWKIAIAYLEKHNGRAT